MRLYRCNPYPGIRLPPADHSNDVTSIVLYAGIASVQIRWLKFDPFFHRGDSKYGSHVSVTKLISSLSFHLRICQKKRKNLVGDGVFAAVIVLPATATNRAHLSCKDSFLT